MTQPLFAEPLAPGSVVSVPTTDRGVLSLIAALAGGAVTPLVPTSIQGTIIVDPANTTGVASSSGNATATVTDPMTGNTFTGPVFSTWVALTSAWGTTAPCFSVNTTIVFTGPNAAADALDFFPTSVAAIGVTVMGLPTLTTTIALASVTAKNRSANQLLQADLGAGRAVNEVLQNTTRGNSVCTVNSLVSGTTFVLTQPFNPLTPPGFTLPTQNNAWANTDTVKVFAYPALLVKRCGCALLGTTPTSATVALAFYHCAITAASGGIPSIGGVNFIETSNANIIITEPVWATQLNFLNHRFVQTWIEGFGNVAAVYGGAGTVTYTGFRLTLDGDFIANGQCVVTGGCGIGFLAGNTATIVRFNGMAVQRFGNQGFGGTAVYGTGNLSFQGQSTGSTSGTFASQWFTSALVNTGVLLNGASTGSSQNNATPTVINGNIATTVANLDAAQGAAGFGGIAFNIGGALVRNTGGP